MSIDPRYFRYLDHFGRTETVRQLHARPDDPNVVALRHDVDHDLDLALEMAFWEHQRGFRASYYLLHSAAYWNDERLVEKCLQLQDFGHEVGLHLNVVTEWVRGEIDDVDARLAELLHLLRGSGVEINGLSAHGDRLCYECGFINYWMFAELCPEDPHAEETGRSAEGVRVDDARFGVEYPPAGALERDDGAKLSLWTSSLAEHGLEYHAFHVRADSYLTDSGGSWTRSADPLELDLFSGRHQVLTHPIYYRGPQRFYLFMSTARSGSKWLTEVLDSGASVTARHEFTLNHQYVDGELVGRKRTGAGFRSLVHRPVELGRSVADVRTWVEDEIVGDWAEANIYLVHALLQTRQYFRDATVVHLHRHPYDVVRSLLERGWYETPDDDHHPVVDVEGWDSLTQLEKTCHYVRRVNEQLLDLAVPRLPLEEVTADRTALSRRLAEIGIATYPRLAAAAHARVVNASRTPPPSLEVWSATARRTVERICGPIAVALGYRRGVGLRPRLAGLLRHVRPSEGASAGLDEGTTDERASLVSINHLTEGRTPLGVSGGTLESIGSEEVSVRPDGQRHTWIFLGSDGERLNDDGSGLPARFGTFVSGRFRLAIDGSHEATPAVFALLFGAGGDLQGRRRLSNLDPGGALAAVSFKPPANCVRFVLAVYVPLTPGIDCIRIRDLQVEQLPVVSREDGRW